jgi:glc operon protein GlcG
VGHRRRARTDGGNRRRLIEMEFEKALEYVLRARAIAKERGLNVSVAVHDTAGHPVAVARGKSWHGPYMAMGKARLASAFRKPTAQLVEQWKDRPLFPMSLTTVLPGEITLNPGGYPIFEDGQFVGAIGVGGGSPAQDDAVARQAANWTDPPPDD